MSSRACSGRCISPDTASLVTYCQYRRLLLFPVINMKSGECPPLGFSPRIPKCRHGRLGVGWVFNCSGSTHSQS